MKKLFTKLGLMVLVLIMSTMMMAPAYSAPTDEYCAANPYASICSDECLTKGNCGVVGDTVANIMRTALIAIGVIAVILIIWAGIRMTIFQDGDSKTWGKARNILIYAVIALVVAALAMVIVELTLGGVEQLEHAGECTGANEYWNPEKDACDQRT